MPSVMKMARAAGVPVIEDAAQHAGATVAGKIAGSFGDVTVLSFGRGKGTTSGRGGALLSRGRAAGRAALVQANTLKSSASTGVLVATAATWTLGRPSLYRIPAAVPVLHLGETVYHEAGEPRRMSRAAVSLLDRTLTGMHAAARARRANALILRDAAEQSRRVDTVRAIPGAESGYLRLPVLLRDDGCDNVSMGITRGYPRPLSSEPELRPILYNSTNAPHGATELSTRLITIPTHHLVNTRDLELIALWLRGK
jgi:dTDP-4-amino-4,6-dideoxygalactose transaminase